jgi:hypothetical protein
LDRSTVLSQPELLYGAVEVWAAEEEMALNETDRGWIKNAITEAFGDHRKRWQEKVRTWSLPSVCIAISIAAFLQWTAYVEFRTHTSDRLDKVESQVSSLRATTAASQPNLKQNQKAAEHLLVEARNKVIPQLPISTVNQTGEAFNTAAESDPNAFKVAVQFAAYRTSLNTPYLGEGWMESPPVPYPEWLRKYAHDSRSPGTSEPRWFTRGMAPIEQAAKFLPLGIPDPRIGKMTEDVRDERIEGGEFRLDRMDLKNQWFVNSVIHYAGSPLKTDHVTFINCTFVFEYGSNARILVGSILSEQPSLTVTIN